ncbi:MAG: THUMP domain-containing protein [Hydrogenophilus sp.]|nr:THUMP domain-containing protein [Hydrogenophilus sp.]
MEGFASAPRGFADLVEKELRALGAEVRTVRQTGVAFRGGWEVMMRANLWLRTAVRVLIAVGECALPPAGGEGDKAYLATGKGKEGREGEVLYRLAREVPWQQWLTPEDRLRVDVRVQRQILVDAVPFLVLRVKDGVCDALRSYYGRRPSVDKEEPTARVVGLVEERRAVLFLDTSGAPLFQRGLRVAAGRAPLKEHVACGILQRVGWQGNRPLVDPLCGSGTFVLEGALLALGVAPGLFRSFAFERWRGVPQEVWRAVRSEAEARLRRLPRLPLLVGSDVEERAVAAAQRNWAALEAAIQQRLPVEWMVRDVSALRPPPGRGEGVVVSNPPYGVRLRMKEEPAVWYGRFGRALRRFSGWQAAVLSLEEQVPQWLGMRPKARWRVDNGGLLCNLFYFEF